ncbi:MAG: hypothetical protein K0S34_330 [Bacillales bacterium]|jgi:hypothetical protein|nr:hypothetical protein [Bacillales bacterium]
MDYKNRILDQKIILWIIKIGFWIKKLYFGLKDFLAYSEMMFVKN